MRFKNTLNVTLVVFTIIVIGFLASVSLASERAVLEQYQWHNRLLVICSKSLDQIDSLTHAVNNDALAERKLRIFVEHSMTLFEWQIGGSLSNISGYSGYCSKDAIGQAFLIGLDSKVKASFLLSDLSFESIYERIDAMPMRRHALINK
ncbi:DUF4174 domain-containing protein [Pseudoalteromonas luteoviolacea]|uniref:DUF4174 domain-containing protein n=1 Tax=Pseudoalteromonas luteoviolacea TaxID=43657 RepID=UPI001F27ACE2|nr:DUF4174 domain-containing protein [Pseudoalteromonas luteoviolacea]MCF6441189.1 DUF4174 domain-containing protein [Pseudoalteromonas luteoviolacea]